MTNKQDRCREDFEAWFAKGWNVRFHENAKEPLDETHAWIGYQAAYNQLSEENERLREALKMISEPRTPRTMRMLAKQALEANKEGE